MFCAQLWYRAIIKTVPVSATYRDMTPTNLIIPPRVRCQSPDIWPAPAGKTLELFCRVAPWRKSAPNFGRYACQLLIPKNPVGIWSSEMATYSLNQSTGQLMGTPLTRMRRLSINRMVSTRDSVLWNRSDCRTTMSPLGRTIWRMSVSSRTRRNSKTRPAVTTQSITERVSQLMYNFCKLEIK